MSMNIVELNADKTIKRYVSDREVRTEAFAKQRGSMIKNKHQYGFVCPVCKYKGKTFFVDSEEFGYCGCGYVLGMNIQ